MGSSERTGRSSEDGARTGELTAGATFLAAACCDSRREGRESRPPRRPRRWRLGSGEVCGDRSGAGSLSAGAGLEETGTSFSVAVSATVSAGVASVDLARGTGAGISAGSVAPRRVALLCPTRSLKAVVAAIAVTAIAIGTNGYQPMTPPTVELPPCLRPMSTHPRPENRIRFLDNSVPICETPPWRCRGIHAIADEGTGVKTGPSTNFGGRYANSRQGRRPKNRLSLSEPSVSKHGSLPRLSPTSRGSTQPATCGNTNCYNQMCRRMQYPIQGRLLWSPQIRTIVIWTLSNGRVGSEYLSMRSIFI